MTKTRLTSLQFSELFSKDKMLAYRQLEKFSGSYGSVVHQRKLDETLEMQRLGFKLF